MIENTTGQRAPACRGALPPPTVFAPIRIGAAGSAKALNSGRRRTRLSFGATHIRGPHNATSNSPATGVSRRSSLIDFAMRSIYPDIRRLDDLGPLRDLARHQRIELLGGVAHRLQAELGQAAEPDKPAQPL